MNLGISFHLRVEIVYCVVSVGGQRTTPQSTGQRVSAKKFSPKYIAQSAVLQAIKRDIEQLYEQELRKGNRPTAKEVVHLYKHGSKQERYSLARVSEEYLDMKELQEGTLYKAETVRNHGIFHKKLLEYLAHIKQPNIEVDGVSYRFAKEFERYMLSVLRYDVTTVRRRIGYLRQVIHFAIEQEYISQSAILVYKMDKVPYKEKPLVTIELAEIRLIEACELRLSEHKKAREMLLFCFWTGCNFGDMKTFDYQQHVITVDGEKWIYKGREKGNRQKYFAVPLAAEAEAVLERNNYQLTVLALGRYNACLKEIAMLAGVEKSLSSKIGRKGFANYHFNDLGLDDTVVSAMMGNTSKVLLKHYTKANLLKIKNALAEAATKK